jgi:hypothetical protein
MDEFIRWRLAHPPRATTVTNVVHRWNGDSMTFSFVATRRVWGITRSVSISGSIALSESDVTLTLELPPLVKALVGEARIRVAFEREFASRIDDHG